jgi:cysteinyl-tRNA synthetase
MGSVKMSKSKGDVKTLSDLAKRGIDPLAFRYFFLQAHYRQQQAYSDEAIQSAAKGLRRLQTITAALEGVEGEGDATAQAPIRARFRDALADDLNAPRAMAVVWEVARSDMLAEIDRRDLLRAFDAVLGLRLAEGPVGAASEEWEQDPRIDGMLAERETARASKDWATADRIRDELVTMKIEIVDTPEGPRWRRTDGG